MNSFFLLLFLVLGCGESDSGDSNSYSINDESQGSNSEFFTVNIDCIEITDEGLYVEGIASALWSVYGCGASGRCMPITAEVMTWTDDDSVDERNTLWANCPEGVEALQIRYLTP